MPQQVETPIASVRSGGYQPGQEVTVGGQTLQVISTDADGNPLFKIKDGGGMLREDSPVAPAVTKKTGGISSGMMAKIISKRDKILALPDGTREMVLEKLFDKTVKIPSAMNNDQRSLIRQRFVDTFMGLPPTADPGQSPEDKARAANMPHGSFGVFRAGTEEGIANMLDAIRHEAYKLHYGKNNPNAPAFDTYATKGLGYAAEQWLRQNAAEQRQFTAPYEERSKKHNVPLLGPITRADVEGGAGKMFSSLPLDLATADLIPGAKGAKLGARILSGAGKGAVGGAVTNPSFGGSMSQGAAGGAAAGALFGMLPGVKPKGSAVGKAAKSAIAGAETNELEKLAQAKFGKSLNDLSADEKIKLVSSWRDESVAATRSAKVEARKQAQAQKIKDQLNKINESVETRRKMDEAKALQKRISEFAKINKRAPTEEELAKLKEGPVAAAAPASTSTPASTPATATPERAPKVPERRTFLRTEDKDVKEFYSYRFQQIRDEIKNAATPEEKAMAERRLAQMAEVQKAHPTSMGDPAEFKVESPEAVKAVQAVADVSKVMSPTGVPTVTKIPEGVSGLTPYQQQLSGKLDEATAKMAATTDPKVASQLKKTVENLKAAINGDPNALARIADAERKAAERARSAATPSVETSVVGSGKAGSSISELVSSTAPNPEEALVKAEEEFYDLTDRLEATGPKGKEMAKNLNMLFKKPPKGMSKQDIIAAGEKALGMLSGQK